MRVRDVDWETMTQGSSHYRKALVRWCVSLSVSRRDWGWHLPSDWADVRQTCRSDLVCWMRATRLTSAEEVVGGVVKARQVCGQLPAALSQSASCPRKDFKRCSRWKCWSDASQERRESTHQWGLLLLLLSVVQPGIIWFFFFFFKQILEQYLFDLWTLTYPVCKHCLAKAKGTLIRYFLSWIFFFFNDDGKF